MKSLRSISAKLLEGVVQRTLTYRSFLFVADNLVVNVISAETATRG